MKSSSDCSQKNQENHYHGDQFFEDQNQFPSIYPQFDDPQSSFLNPNLSQVKSIKSQENIFFYPSESQNYQISLGQFSEKFFDTEPTILRSNQTQNLSQAILQIPKKTQHIQFDKISFKKTHQKLKSKIQVNKKVYKPIGKVQIEKDRRKSKREQSLTQRFLKFSHGYHFQKNFAQFYHTALSKMYQTEEIYNALSVKEKVNAIQKIIKDQLKSLQKKLTISQEFYKLMRKRFSPFQKKFINKLFDQLFIRSYEIMLNVQIRRLSEMSEEQSQGQKKLTSKFMDVKGDRQMMQSFDEVFEKVRHSYEKSEQSQNFSDIKQTLINMMK